MTMIVPEAEGAASSVGKKFGLTNSQKAGAISAGLPQPRTHHPYILGLILITTGGFMLIGSVTGTLPSMLAALFVPNALDDTGGNPLEPLASTLLGKNATQGSVNAFATIAAQQNG